MIQIRNGNGYILAAEPCYDLVAVTDNGFGRHEKHTIVANVAGLFEWVEMPTHKGGAK